MASNFFSNTNGTTDNSFTIGGPNGTTIFNGDLDEPLETLGKSGDLYISSKGVAFIKDTVWNSISSHNNLNDRFVSDAHAAENISYNETSDVKIALDTLQTQIVNPMTTLGDLIKGGTSGVLTRLGVGTAGQVLSVNTGGTDVEWKTPATGGGGIWTEITRATPSAAASVIFKDLPTGYKAFKISYVLNTSGTNDFLALTASTNNGTSFISADYFDTILGRSNVSSNSAAYARFTYAGGGGTAYIRASGSLILNGLTGSPMGGFTFNGIANANTDYGQLSVASGGLFGSSVAAYNAFKILSTETNATLTGTIILEGLV